MKKKFLLSFLVFFLVGCEEKVPPPEPFSGELTIWTAVSPDFFEALGKEFMAALDETEGKIRVIPFRDDAELQETFVHTLARGEGPDVIVSDTDFIFQKKDLFVPFRTSESLEAEYLVKNFLSFSLKGLLFGDTMLGVPIGIDTLGLISNTEQVQTPPNTWEAFRVIVSELTEPDNSFQRFSRSGAAIGRVDNVWRGKEVLENILFQMAGKMFSEDGREAFFTQKQGVTSKGQRVNFTQEAFRFFLDFAIPGSGQTSWNEFLSAASSESKEWRPFLEGRVSMIFGNAGDVEALLLRAKNDPNALLSPEHISVSSFPQFHSEEVSSPRRVVSRVVALAVPHEATHPSLAWRFLTFAIRPDTLRAFYRETKLASPRSELLLEQKADPVFGIFAEQASYAEPLLLPVARNFFREKIADLVEKVLSQKYLLPDGLIRLEQEFTQKLKRNLEIQQQIEKRSPE
ncbi:extracellular solute-binding protein [Candidatus Gracilibacteria bacterium]|nr:extracellular solute-binding protein [Candidatus Gracilibacteria bacterium]